MGNALVSSTSFALLFLTRIDYRAVGMWATGRLSTYPQRRPVDPVGNRDVIHKYTGRPSRCEGLLWALIALRGLWISALELSIGIFDPHVFFEQATEFERAKVDVPDTVIDLLEPYVLPGAHDADVDPIPLPADAAVEAHVAHLEVAGVVEWGQL